MICIPLYFIHKNEIVHRDLKPDNILQKFIGGREIFLITDFGISSKARTKFLTTIKQNTALYASLEQINEENAHSAFDIWALGIILYTLMAKKEPFPQKESLKDLRPLKKIIEKNYLRITLRTFENLSTFA